jgi:hypothetical protein
MNVTEPIESLHLAMKRILESITYDASTRTGGLVSGMYDYSDDLAFLQFLEGKHPEITRFGIFWGKELHRVHTREPGQPWKISFPDDPLASRPSAAISPVAN